MHNYHKITPGGGLGLSVTGRMHREARYAGPNQCRAPERRAEDSGARNLHSNRPRKPYSEFTRGHGNSFFGSRRRCNRGLVGAANCGSRSRGRGVRRDITGQSKRPSSTKKEKRRLLLYKSQLRFRLKHDDSVCRFCLTEASA